jgi:hypothetical protein
MSINKEDKVLYIIGNGFDLNLGLKTSYNDFFKYTGILTMRKVVEELKKNRNIENYDEAKLNKFIENLKKHNILIDENDVYLLKLKKNIKMQDTEKIRDSMYSFQRKIFITLKSEKTDKFIDDYGLFVIFLILMETEKDNEWQWVEEKILSYIEELIELLSNNFEETAMYIKNNLIEVEKKIENFINTIVKEKDVKKVKKIFLKNGDKKIYENLLKLFEKKIEKYFKNSQEKSEELKNDIKNIIYKIEYINFILQILFTDFEKKIVFESLNLKIVNINNGEKIDLKEQLHVFENEFGNYVKKINEIAKKIIETDFKYKEIENINDFIEIQKFSLKKMEKIFSNTKESKYVINFNYTDYLDKIAKKVNIMEIKYIHGDVKNVISNKILKNDDNRSLRFKKTRDKLNVNKIEETLKYLREYNNIIEDIKKSEQERNVMLSLNIIPYKLVKEIILKIIDKYADLRESVKKLIESIQFGSLGIEKSSILKILNNKIKEKNKIEFEIESIFLNLKENFEKDIEDYTEKINGKNIKKNSNIIFGIDKIQIKNFKNELKTFIKSNRRKNMESEWKQLLNEHKFTKIYFYGHSLADADYTFFEDLFNMIDITTNSTIKLIFLYSKGYSYEKNVKKLIGTYYFEKFKSEGKLELIEV